MLDDQPTRKRRPNWRLVVAGATLLVFPVLAASVPCHQRDDWYFWPVVATPGGGQPGRRTRMAQSAGALIARALITIVVGAICGYVVGLGLSFTPSAASSSSYASALPGLERPMIRHLMLWSFKLRSQSMFEC